MVSGTPHRVCVCVCMCELKAELFHHLSVLMTALLVEGLAGGLLKEQVTHCLTGGSVCSDPRAKFSHCVHTMGSTSTSILHRELDCLL